MIYVLNVLHSFLSRSYVWISPPGTGFPQWRQYFKFKSNNLRQ